MARLRPVAGLEIRIVATLLRLFLQNAVERSHKCVDFQQRTTRPKSVQSAISLSIKGVLAPEASPFSTELSTGFCGTLLPGDDCRLECTLLFEWIRFSYLERPQLHTIDFSQRYRDPSLGINSHGDIVGFYGTADKLSPGFLRTGDSLTPIDVPGAA